MLKTTTEERHIDDLGGAPRSQTEAITVERRRGALNVYDPVQVVKKDGTLFAEGVVESPLQLARDVGGCTAEHLRYWGGGAHVVGVRFEMGRFAWVSADYVTPLLPLPVSPGRS